MSVLTFFSPLFLFSFLRKGLAVSFRLAWTSLCSPGWPWKCGHPPPSAFRMWGLPIRATVPGTALPCSTIIPHVFVLYRKQIKCEFLKLLLHFFAFPFFEVLELAKQVLSYWATPSHVYSFVCVSFAQYCLWERPMSMCVSVAHLFSYFMFYYVILYSLFYFSWAFG